MNDGNDDHDEQWLRATLATDAGLDDDAFTAAVLARVGRAHHRRRALLGVGYAAAALAAAAGAFDASAVLAVMTPGMTASAMTLSAICSAVWIATVE